ERATEVLEVLLDDVQRRVLAVPRAREDVGRASPRARRPGDVGGLERRSAEERLDAAALAAVAGRPLRVDRVVAPLTRDVLRATPGLAAEHQAAPDAGAEDPPEDQVVVAARAEPRLGEREAVGVVLDPHRQAEPGLEVVAQRAAVQARGV